MVNLTTSLLSGGFTDSVKNALETFKKNVSELLGFTVEIWQMAIVAVLAVALIVCLIIAIVNPSKRRKKRLKRYFENREQAERITEQIRQKDEEISELQKVIAEAEKEAEEKKAAIIEDNKTASDKDELYNSIANEKIVSLSAKQRKLSEKLTKQQTGIFRGLKKGKARNTKLAINAIAEEQKLRSLEISKRNSDRAKRDSQMKSALSDVNVELNSTRSECLAKISEKELERKLLLEELERINSQEVKLSSKDAGAILKQYEKDEKIEKKTQLQKAVDDLEKAKAEYRNAQALRAKYEKEREDALAALRDDAKVKAVAEKKEAKKKVRYAPPKTSIATKKEAAEVNNSLGGLPSTQSEQPAPVKPVQEEPFFDENAPVNAADDEVVITDLTYENDPVSSIMEEGEKEAAVTETTSDNKETEGEKVEEVKAEPEKDEFDDISDDTTEKEAEPVVTPEPTEEEPLTPRTETQKIVSEKIEEEMRRELSNLARISEKANEEADETEEVKEAEEAKETEEVKETEEIAEATENTEAEAETTAEDTEAAATETVAETTETTNETKETTDETEQNGEISEEIPEAKTEESAKESTDETESTEEVATEETKETEETVEPTETTEAEKTVEAEDENGYSATEDEPTAEEVTETKVVAETEETPESEATETTEEKETETTETTEEKEPETSETTEEKEAEASDETADEVISETAATEIAEETEKAENGPTLEYEEPVVYDEPVNIIDADESTVETKPVKTPFMYNDGIPATPIHKKSKFSKPITKIVTKKRVEEPEVKTDEVAATETKKNAYNGKWKVEKTDDDKVFATLTASNGGSLLSTQGYSNINGLKTAISNIKKNLADGNVSVNADKNGKFVFKIFTPSGRTIVTSGVYGSKFQCEKALESTRRFAETAVIVE